MNDSFTKQTSLTSGQLISNHRCLQTNVQWLHACTVQAVTPHTAAVMGENDESEIIEHHDDEEMEKRRKPRNHSTSFVESLSSSEKEGHSSTQSSHRLLAYSDALISIIATVMVRGTHREPAAAADEKHGTWIECLECTFRSYMTFSVTRLFSCIP